MWQYVKRQDTTGMEAYLRTWVEQETEAEDKE
jgi:hypothetical protein